MPSEMANTADNQISLQTGACRQRSHPPEVGQQLPG
jgi:hypothetical protein